MHYPLPPACEACPVKGYCFPGECQLRRHIADIRCACGSRECVLFDPGENDARDLFLLRRGRPVTGRCLACWPVQKEAADAN